MIDKNIIPKLADIAAILALILAVFLGSWSLTSPLISFVCTISSIIIVYGIYRLLKYRKQKYISKYREKKIQSKVIQIFSNEESSINKQNKDLEKDTPKPPPLITEQINREVNSNKSIERIPLIEGCEGCGFSGKGIPVGEMRGRCPKCGTIAIVRCYF